MVAAKAADIDLAREFVGSVRGMIGAELKKAFLFGSRAKGVALAGSDYDILLVLKHRDGKLIDTIYETVMDYLLDREVDVSLKIYSEDRFLHDLQLGVPFATEVAATGVPL